MITAYVLKWAANAPSAQEVGRYMPSPRDLQTYWSSAQHFVVRPMDTQCVARLYSSTNTIAGNAMTWPSLVDGVECWFSARFLRDSA